MAESTNTSSPNIQSHAKLYNYLGNISFLNSPVGVVKLEGNTFTFIDSGGKKIIELPTSEIEKCSTGGGGRANIRFLKLILKEKGDNKSKLITFGLYKPGGEEGTLDIKKLGKWRKAFREAGVKNDNKAIILARLAIVIAITALIVITHWSN